MLPRLSRLVMPMIFAAFIGCKTNTPMVRHHNWTMQTKLQAVQHWREFAVKMADNLQNDGQFNGRTIYVETLGEDSEFSAAFGKLLVAALMDRGFRIAQTNQGADLKLVVGHQVLVHGRRFGFSMNATGVLSGLGLGARNLITGDESGSPGKTRGELLTTVWIHKQSRVLYCKNQIAYINAKDASLYLTPEEFDLFSKSEDSRSGLLNWFSATMGDNSRW